MLTWAERTNNKYEFYNRMSDKWGTDLRSAMPGIVQSFDDIEQTVVVQPAIQERIVDQDGNVNMVNLPLLLDVPVAFIGGGGYTLTFPIKKDDECLVIFGDQCIDSWWSLGGVQVPLEQRRHDLSDAFVIVGLRSQPRRLPSYSTESVQLRSDDGIRYIEVTDSEINLIGNQDIDYVTTNIPVKVNAKKNVVNGLIAGKFTWVQDFQGDIRRLGIKFDNYQSSPQSFEVPVSYAGYVTQNNGGPLVTVSGATITLNPIYIPDPETYNGFIYIVGM